MIRITQFKTVLLKSAIIAATLFGASSCGNSPKPEDTKDIAEEHNEAKFDNTGKEKDAQFLVNAAEMNVNEIKLALLAQQNTKTKIVIELAKLMEDGHRKSLDELTILAAKKTITIPTSPTDKAQEAYTKLSNKSGTDLDKEYCEMVIDEHKNAISVFEKAASESKDEEIKAWANATLPDLRMHLDHAITCQKKCEKMK